MAEQVRVDEVVTNIMYGLAQVIAEEAKTEQERMNEAKAVLYMTLSHMQMYVEETALSTNVDCSAEWVRLYLATMVIRGCTEMTVESYRQEYTTFFHTLKKAIPDITTGDIRGYLAHCKLVRHNKDVTINNKTRMLRGLFTWLTEEDYIDRTPCCELRTTKWSTASRRYFPTNTLQSSRTRRYGMDPVVLPSWTFSIGRASGYRRWWRWIVQTLISRIVSVLSMARAARSARYTFRVTPLYTCGIIWKAVQTTTLHCS